MKRNRDDHSGVLAVTFKMKLDIIVEEVAQTVHDAGQSGSFFSDLKGEMVDAEGIEHTFSLIPGSHDWIFWHKACMEFLTDVLWK